MTKIDWAKAEQAIPFLENLIEIIKSEKFTADYNKYWDRFFKNHKVMVGIKGHNVIELQYDVEYSVKLNTYLGDMPKGSAFVLLYGVDNGTEFYRAFEIYGVKWLLKEVKDFNKEEFECPEQLGGNCYYKIEYLTE